MAHLEVECKRPLADGAIGYTQNVRLNGRELVVVMERHEAAVPSASYRKPAAWWIATVVAWEPQIETLRKGRVHAGATAKTILHIFGLTATCFTCNEDVAADTLYVSGSWNACDACVDEAAPVDDSLARAMAVVA